MTAAPLLHVRDGRRFTAHVRDGRRFTAHVRDGRRFTAHVRDGGIPASVQGAVMTSLLRVPATTTTGTPRVRTPEAIPWQIGGGTTIGGGVGIRAMTVLPPDPGWLYAPGPQRGGDGKAGDDLLITDAVGATWDFQFRFGIYTATPTTASVAIGEDGIWVAPTGGQVQWSATGGTGPYTWELLSEAEARSASTGGSVTSGGLYTAGPSFGWDRLKVTDSLGAIAYATVQVDPMRFQAPKNAAGWRGSVGDPAMPYGIVEPTGGTAPYVVTLQANGTGASISPPRPLRASLRIDDQGGAPLDFTGWTFDGRLYTQRGHLIAEGLAVTAAAGLLEVALPLPATTPFPTAVARVVATTAGALLAADVPTVVVEALLIAEET